MEGTLHVEENLPDKMGGNWLVLCNPLKCSPVFRQTFKVLKHLIAQQSLLCSVTFTTILVVSS